MIHARILLLALLLICGGCARFYQLEREVSTIKQGFPEFSLEIASSASGQQIRAFIPVLLNEQNTAVKGYRVIIGKHSSRLRLTPGHGKLFVFEDLNHDFVFNPEEPWQLIDANALQPGAKVQAKLSRAEGFPAFLADSHLSNLEDLDIARVASGTVAQLNQRAFSAEAGKLSMWQPLAFFEQGYTGLFFLEPYDPDRIPVVLIHGIGGTGGDFAPLIEHIDRSRYQIWLVNYPSALPLDFVAKGIYQLLTRAVYSHRVKGLHLVGHSMGGLVSLGVLGNCENANCQRLLSLSTIASPLGGHSAAASGVEHAPVVMPCWRDLAPGSDYLKRLQEYSFRIPWQLIFAYRMEGMLNKESSDGTIALHSQLAAPFQDRASRLMGLNAGHVSVLAQPDLARGLQQFWQHAEGHLDSAKAAEGNSPP